MKKFVLFVFIVMFCFTAVSHSESEEVFEIKEKPAFNYVYMSFSGSFSTIPQKIGEFIQEFFKQGLKPSSALISVYHNSPEHVTESELKWDIGFPVAEKTIIQSPLKNGIYEKKTVLEYLHKGPYEKLIEVYGKIQSYMDQNNLTVVIPSYEFYLNSPMEVKPEELLTRIEIPVKKK